MSGQLGGSYPAWARVVEVCCQALEKNSGARLHFVHGFNIQALNGCTRAALRDSSTNTSYG